MREKLREILQALRLQGMIDSLDKELDRAEKEASPVADLLYRLALEEQRVRQEKSLANRLKQFTQSPYEHNEHHDEDHSRETSTEPA